MIKLLVLFVASLLFCACSTRDVIDPTSVGRVFGRVDNSTLTRVDDGDVSCYILSNYHNSHAAISCVKTK